MVFDRNDFLGNLIKCNGVMDSAVKFVLDTQLKNRELWQKFAEVFTTRDDTEFGRWRGEYFGKQMRGAVIVYEYLKDDELYDIMTETVKSLLKNQDELGRFSTYHVEKEFHGWDVWCRKYVLVGMLYYMQICKCDALKSQILTACKKHLDYIISKVGDGENKMPITATSHWWGCVNSCTILEPTIEMYKQTGDKKYLDFAEYIISTGGCSDCNLIDLALKGEIAPYQYPVTKAYEMMSFYEGLVAYYEVTGNKKYLDATVKFMDAVAKTDITVIGCSGCTHELFDNSSVMQTEPHENIMQETCVTVTWMRVLRRLFLLTKDSKYIDEFEISGYNALYGSLNVELNEQFNMEDGKYWQAMAFDSYSPLYMNVRGRGIGGFNKFLSGGYYGCCLAIGACGVGIMPFTAVMQGKGEVYLNYYFNGETTVYDACDKPVRLVFESEYPSNGKVKITVDSDFEIDLTLQIRKPSWCERMTIGAVVANDGYNTVKVKGGEVIEIDMEMQLKTVVLNGKVAFKYGALTLASDEHKAQRDIRKPIANLDSLKYTVLPREDGELLRIECDFAGDKLILADYQSCGKKWLTDKPLMTAWFDLQK